MTFFASDHLNDLFPAHSSSLPMERGTTGAGVHSSTPAPVTVTTRGTDRPGARPISGQPAPGDWPAGENDISKTWEALNAPVRACGVLRAVVLAGAVLSSLIAIVTIGPKAVENAQRSIALQMISEGFSPRP